jgi:hypothetical protein
MGLTLFRIRVIWSLVMVAGRRGNSCDTHRPSARQRAMELTQLPRDIHSSRTKVWAVALAFAATVPIWACSGVGPPGKPVVFGDQTNIIIWDEANQTEHFIRNATFKSGADDFGFIAPTPGKPTLSEASSKAFNTLASLQPVPVFKGGFGGGAGAARGMKEDAVRVIQEADIAGYHATTLWSKDAHAINNWMNDHGYISTPEVEKWCERYCSRGWYLTAYKVIDRKKLIASTGTVRMSFKTRRPFNPFYVPASNIPINGGGTLIVYFVSVGDYNSNIGNTAPWQNPQWKAPIPEAQSALLAKQVKIPAEAIPDNVQVSTFIDYNFPRVTADDIYFSKKPVESMPKPVLTTPVVPFVLAGLGVLAVAVRLRR